MAVSRRTQEPRPGRPPPSIARLMVASLVAVAALVGMAVYHVDRGFHESVLDAHRSLAVATRSETSVREITARLLPLSGYLERLGAVNVTW